MGLCDSRSSSRRINAILAAETVVAEVALKILEAVKEVAVVLVAVLVVLVEFDF